MAVSISESLRGDIPPSEDPLYDARAERIVEVYERAQSLFGISGSSPFDMPEPRDEDELLRDLISFNGLARGLPTANRKVDGEGFIQARMLWGDSTWLQYTPPNPGDRSDLIGLIVEKAFGITRHLDRATLLGLGINAVHPFADANGRVARYAYIRYSRQFNDPTDPRMRKVALIGITQGNGRDVVDLDPSRIELENRFLHASVVSYSRDTGVEVQDIPLGVWRSHDVSCMVDRNVDNLLVPKGLTTEDKDLINAVLCDEAGAFLIYRFLRESGYNTEEYLLPRKPDSSTRVINGEKLMSLLDSNKARELGEILWQYKRDYISAIGDIFTLEKYSQYASEFVEFYKPKWLATSAKSA